jgi:hypothetical protein
VRYLTAAKFNLSNQRRIIRISLQTIDPASPLANRHMGSWLKI